MTNSATSLDEQADDQAAVLEAGGVPGRAAANATDSTPASAGHTATAPPAATISIIKSDEGEKEGAPDHAAAAADPPGEPPFDPAFAPLAPPFLWWQDFVLLTVLGAALGAFAYCYLKAITEVTNAWLGADGNGAYPDAASLRFGSGRAWWVGLCAAGGLVVGLAKAAMRLDVVPSFITELRGLHSDPVRGAKVGLATLLTLMMGAPMGPEAGLGAVAGAAGWLVATSRCRGMRLCARLRARVHVLAAFCSVFSGLMPNPLAAVLMTVELGRPLAELRELTVMGLVTLLTGGSVAAFVVYYAIAGYMYLHPLLTGLLVEAAVVYDQVYIVEGILFGVMGAALSLAYIFIAGVVRAVVGPLRSALEARLGRWPRVVLLATLGGTAVGLLGWAMPLVLTDGAGQLEAIFRDRADIGSSALAASFFAKALAYHLCAECGMHGGLFLPMLAMSSMLGAVFMNETSVSPVTATACSLIALGAGLAPAPFFLSILSVSVFTVGPQALVPVFATAVTSHLLCMGLGLPQRLVALSAARKAAAGGTAPRAVED